MPEEFTWPCDKRKAHGPHKHDCGECRSLDCEGCVDCPGVKAHPHTMIGGKMTIREQA